ncbi:hypothetical protein SKAU_G00290890 [Synaphobranchus kaupii]|uniref:Uncharacterized protein n=1 Tax=Synaphobranchus kaupii TaxID=118154 RepID=A0A9Q1ETP6_SYNKA|nr:hypothetical protein SKAU_G00290890 [Synaphobranchus kaupii]
MGKKSRPCVGTCQEAASDKDMLDSQTSVLKCLYTTVKSQSCDSLENQQMQPIAPHQQALGAGTFNMLICSVLIQGNQSTIM